MDNIKKSTDFGTLLGLAAGISIIFIGINQSGGSLYWFFNLNSILIVVGGTFAATMVNLPLKALKNLPKILSNVFRADDADYDSIIEEIVIKAQKAKKDGLLSLEADLPKMREGFFKNGIELAINERESSRLRTFLNLELNNISSRHIAGQELFLYMASYAPAFGMLGTVLGLIVMMNNFSSGGGDASESLDVAERFAELLAGMGLALITTFYGVFFANMIFLPIGGKLKRLSENEMMLKSIVVEGIISIHAREHPILIREKLMTFIPSQFRYKES
ncbi:MotA/TolQ/ExbB proton channel family protein [Candidatus Marinimicrobia bacterium]|jgi:chemotaxis protein MotA|nr:MotA/TolQ/ExbB proton channel family protein [Candidatus Neomarinimicrobiota bacterium]MDA9656722.1 MotA/TolQ/ExbB proton channel family protein [Candidatus Neomarinimicrobiota bacterium]MDA9671663.1 MotA/TolQ/ExbB proton channel family protein [bacterium]MDC0631061.1 MotA/TolQ/ExbB proton channel family protein [Candidatus Neomarinimicrobiota bacterium]